MYYTPELAIIDLIIYKSKHLLVNEICNRIIKYKELCDQPLYLKI